jgi:hypothetical protein
MIDTNPSEFHSSSDEEKENECQNTGYKKQQNRLPFFNTFFPVIIIFFPMIMFFTVCLYQIVFRILFLLF